MKLNFVQSLDVVKCGEPQMALLDEVDLWTELPCIYHWAFLPSKKARIFFSTPTALGW